MQIKVIGGGLAGVEAAYHALKHGYDVDLYEMRSVKNTLCHKTQLLAELVCSNSLKSFLPDTASGTLKEEMRQLDSLVLKCAERTAVKAGSSLAVDRELFSLEIEKELKAFQGFRIIREEVTTIDTDTQTPTIIATGPMSSDAIADEFSRLFGGQNLHFYDAVAPIVSADSIDMTKAFYASRYGKGEDDYLNCPMSKEEYEALYEALVTAETVTLHSFEKKELFEGCMPIEEIARRGKESMRFGPLRPVGIRHPETAEKYYAVLQLRSENLSRDMLNLVGFQTNLTFKEQKRVFGLVPALANAEYLRYGVMHHNTYIDSPKLLTSTFALRSNPYLRFAGQLVGVEGYMESAVSGLMACLSLLRFLEKKEEKAPPLTTISGALSRYISECSGDFQPMNSNFGILPPLDNPLRDKKLRKLEYSKRSAKDMQEYIKALQ